MDREVRVLPIQEIRVQKAEDGKRTVGGYVNKFDQLSEDLGDFREKVRKGAFARSLKEQPVLAFWNHNSDIVLGNTENKTLRAFEDDIGLGFELDLPDTTAGIDAGKLIERGDVSGVSFGFRTLKEEWDETDKNNPIRTLVDVQLYEISPTAIPAYPQSVVSARSILDEHRKKEDEKILENERVETEQREQAAQSQERAAKLRRTRIQLMKEVMSR